MEFQKLNPDDWQELSKIGLETYTDTFKGTTPDADFQDYLDKAFQREKLVSELSHPDSHFYFAIEDNQIVGYMKLNVKKAQSESHAPEAMEIERFYVRPAFKRRGYGKAMMDFALEVANHLNKPEVWLGVWEHNYSAQDFYGRYGFVRTGDHQFVMGEDIQTDYIYTKTM